MASEQDLLEPPVKKERIDDDFPSEMVNYEIPLHIEVPIATDAEVDPLMPLEDPLKLPDSAENSSAQSFGIKIKDEIKKEVEEPSYDFSVNCETTASDTDLAENSGGASRCSDTPQITNSQIHESHFEDSNPTAECSSELIDIEVVKEELTDNRSTSADHEMPVNKEVADSGPEHHGDQQDVVTPMNEPLPTTDKDSSILLEKPAIGGPKLRPLMSVINQNAISLLKKQVNDLLKPSPVVGSKPEIIKRAAREKQATCDDINSAAATSQSSATDLSSSSTVSISELLKNPFLSKLRSREEKDRIVLLSRPCPTFPEITDMSVKNVYQGFPWLCASATLKKFFCWPCLLLANSSDHSRMWGVEVSKVAQGHALKKAAFDHSEMPEHRLAVKTLKIWEEIVRPKGKQEPNIVKPAITQEASISRDTTESNAATDPSRPNAEQEPSDSSIISISRLLKHPFLSSFWSLEQQNEIVRMSRPCPDFPEPHLLVKSLYQNIPWLCGSASLEKFFCWPCLLFSMPSDPSNVWSVPLSSVKIHEFSKDMDSHRNSLAHQAAVSALNSWEESSSFHSLSKHTKKASEFHCLLNDKISKNRKLLAILIQTVCYVKREDPNPTIEDYEHCFSRIVSSSEEIRGTLERLSGEPQEPAMDFLQRFVTHAEEALEDYMKSKVSNELKNAHFVTLFFEDLSNTVDKSWVVVIAHFVDQDGEIRQRVVRFLEVGYNRSADTFFALFQEVTFELGLRLKIAGYTYSATLVEPSDIATFNGRVEKWYPMAKFFHFQGHEFLRLLFQAVSHHNKSCWNFFQMITELQVFFKKHLLSTFNHFEELNSGPETVKGAYDFDAGFILTLRRHFPSVLESFESILRSPGEWDEGVAAQAPIFISFLHNFNNRFMITLMAHLYLAVHDLPRVFEKRPDIAEWKELIRRAIANLINLKHYGFKDIATTASHPLLVREPQKPSREPSEMITVFIEIIDTAISFVSQRFKNLDYCYVDVESAKHLLKFGTHWLGSGGYLNRVHHSPEEIERLKIQIHLFETDPTFKDKTLVETLRCFHQKKLVKALPELQRLLNFSMTIPSLLTSLRSPVLAIIEEYQSDKSLRFIADNLNAEQVNWMDKELLRSIWQDAKLAEEVVDVVTLSEGTQEFCYVKDEKTRLKMIEE